MRNKFKKGKISTSIAAALLLSACGGGGGSSDETSSASSYSYQNEIVCADSDLNGICSENEKKLSSSQNLPKIISYQGAILTTPAELDFISPFTTLIHSEMLFNPLVENNISKAKSYLQKSLGDKIGLDFSVLDTNHGPNNLSRTLVKTLAKAQNKGKGTIYTNISVAIDLMIEHGTLDLSSFDITSAHEKHVTLDNTYVIHGSQNISTLDQAKSISLNPATGQLVIVTSDDSVQQLDTIKQETSGVPTKQNYLDISTYDDDDDKYGGSINDLNGYVTTTSNKLVQVVPALNGVQTFKLYQPTSTGTDSWICNASGSNGIFLTNILDNPTAQTTQKAQITFSQLEIDTYSGGSGSTVTPPPVVEEVITPISSASCFNDNVTLIQPLYKQDALLAVLETGSFSDTRYEVKRLSSKDLTMNSASYLLPSKTSKIIPSLSENELLIIDESSTNPDLPIIVSTQSLTRTTTLNKANLTNATFITDNTLAVSTSDNKIQWITKAPEPRLLNEISVDSAVLELQSTPDGKISMAVTNSFVYIIDNIAQKLIKKQTKPSGSNNQLYMLENKALVIQGSQLDYYQFSSISGPSLAVAGQLVTKELVVEWEKSANSHWQATNLGYILQQVDPLNNDADRFLNISINWIPGTASSSDDVTGVELSGLFRGEWVTLYKEL